MTFSHGHEKVNQPICTPSAYVVDNSCGPGVEIRIVYPPIGGVKSLSGFQPRLGANGLGVSVVRCRTAGKNKNGER